MNLRNVPFIGHGVLTAAALVCLAGCAASPFESPLVEDTQADLRRSVVEAARRELVHAQNYPRAVVTQRDEDVNRLGISPEVLGELNQKAGPASYAGVSLVLGPDLTDQPTQTVLVNLQRMVRTSAERNVAVQFARIAPAIGESQVIAAEAAFDWVFFSNLNFQDNDSPRVGTSFAGSSSPVRSDQFQSVTTTLGLRRTLIGGGRLTLQHDYGYTLADTPGQVSIPDPANQVSVTAQYDQPLLRNMGSEVTQAEVRIARNAERTAIQTLRRDLIRTITDTERTYWELVLAQQDVLILTRLLERGERVRDQLRARSDIDANQSQIATATARVEERRSDVLRAQTQLRLVSDRLKGLVNDPDFPVGSEVVLLPADRAVDEPVKFGLLESLRDAITNRPEVNQAVLSIDDASIRQVVAQNAKLPDLSIRLQTRFSSLDDSADQAYRRLFNGQFVDYLVGLAFEAPIGNRRAEADYRRRLLERAQTVAAYRNTIQQVVAEVKSALDRVILNYRLIAQTKISRIAAAEALRVLEVEKELAEYTVERLQVELNTEEALANNERSEMQALVDYNTALAELFQAIGTTLERNGIQFVVPTSEDVLWYRAQNDPLRVTPAPTPAEAPAAGAAPAGP